MAVIFVVEDDALICELTTLTVEDWGHLTLSASDVGEALEILRSSQQIDLLFTDIHLKEASSGGFVLAREATALRPHLPVLYTTGNDITIAMRAQFPKEAECLRKPYSPHQLHRMMDQMLAMA